MKWTCYSTLVVRDAFSRNLESGLGEGVGGGGEQLRLWLCSALALRAAAAPHHSPGSTVGTQTGTRSAVAFPAVSCRGLGVLPLSWLSAMPSMWPSRGAAAGTVNKPRRPRRQAF